MTEELGNLKLTQKKKLVSATSFKDIKIKNQQNEGFDGKKLYVLFRIPLGMLAVAICTGAFFCGKSNLPKYFPKTVLYQFLILILLVLPNFIAGYFMGYWLPSISYEYNWVP